jgi:hypothetical protein
VTAPRGLLGKAARRFQIDGLELPQQSLLIAASVTASEVAHVR